MRTVSGWVRINLLGGASLAAALVVLGPAAAGSGAAGAFQDGGGLLESLEGLEDDVEELLRLERQEAYLNIRRGRWTQARKTLRAHLKEDPEDAESRALMAVGYLVEERLDEALREARRTLESAPPGSVAGQRAARVWMRVLEEQGQASAVPALLAEGGALFGRVQPAQRLLDAWAQTRIHLATGQRQAARALAVEAAKLPAQGWQDLWARGRLQQVAGDLVGASRSLVEGLQLAEQADGAEPDLLVALAGVYFESEQEVEARGKRSAGSLLKKALDRHPDHAEALLGLHALHRLNRLRVSRSPEEILHQLLEAHPGCIRGIVQRAYDDLSDGHLPRVRYALSQLEEQAPGRRDVRTLRAALAFVEHDHATCDQALANLLDEAPHDSEPEREVGRLLVELYRFQEALPFLRAAVTRDASDHQAWTRLGHALANTGLEDEARRAFTRAVEEAKGRQDAWRDNMRRVLTRIEEHHVHETYGPLAFSWMPDAAEVFRTYWVPFYTEAREELAERYGFTPERTTIQVFREHGDFSVRSVGYEGFPALGVCFGPVVTSLSPLSEMRGQFSWARTGFHEFSHVVHLGLSHNRCPRWITEGLATYEEVNRNPAWTRNMRLELLDARANGHLIPVRELNRAFRGPRILFGYYQGGLLCEMLIAQHGFSPMVRLLQAFDRGDDLDTAIRSVFQTTPEAIDADFERFVDGRLAGLDCEPLHDPDRVRRLALGLSEDPPTDPTERAAWAQHWLTVAYTHYQQKSSVDAAEALRRATRAGLETARESFLRAGLALDRGDLEEAEARWREGYERGGREFRSLVAMGKLLENTGELEEALHWYQEAEMSFPGYPQPALSSELLQASLFEQMGSGEQAMAAKARWLAFNPGNYDLHVQVGDWFQAQGEHAQAATWYEKANEVDPFRRDLHLSWGRSLRAAGDLAGALREFGVALVVPAELDVDHLGPPVERDGPPVPRPLSDPERAAIHFEMAQIAEGLELPDRVRYHLGQALVADPGHLEAVQWFQRLPAPETPTDPR